MYRCFGFASPREMSQIAQTCNAYVNLPMTVWHDVSASFFPDSWEEQRSVPDDPKHQLQRIARFRRFGCLQGGGRSIIFQDDNDEGEDEDENDVPSIDLPTFPLSALAIDAATNRVFAADVGGGFTTFNMSDDGLVGRLVPRSPSPEALLCASSGLRDSNVIVGTSGGHLWLLKTENNSLRPDFRFQVASSVAAEICCCLVLDEGLVCCGDSTGTFHVIDLLGRAQRQSIQLSTTSMTPTPILCLTAARMKTPRRMNTWRVFAGLQSGEIQMIQISVSGVLLLQQQQKQQHSSGGACALTVEHQRILPCRRTTTQHTAVSTPAVLCLASRHCGSQVVVGYRTGVVKLWEIATPTSRQMMPKLLLTFQAHSLATEGGVEALQCIGDACISGGGDGAVVIRCLRTGRLLSQYRGDASPVRTIAVSKTHICAGFDTGMLRTWHFFEN
jgi:WD40 repeat protein